MDKMTMAQRFAEKMIINGSRWGDNNVSSQLDNIAINAWKLADAMQVEADKRNTEREQRTQKFMKAISIGIEKADTEEWQPDWSQAPEKYNWYAVDKSGQHGFFVMKPIASSHYGSWVKDEDDFSDFLRGDFICDYVGNWQDSLRKRPEGK